MRKPLIITIAVLVVIISAFGFLYQRYKPRNTGECRNHTNHLMQPIRKEDFDLKSQKPDNIVTPKSSQPIKTNNVPTLEPKSSNANVKKKPEAIKDPMKNMDEVFEEYKKKYPNIEDARKAFNQHRRSLMEKEMKTGEAKIKKDNIDHVSKKKYLVEQLKTKLNEITKVEAIVSKEYPMIEGVLSDMKPSEVLVVGTIKSDNKIFNELKKELIKTADSYGKKSIAYSMLSNIWLRIYFNEKDYVFAEFFPNDNQFFFITNEPKESASSAYCQSTKKLRQIIINNMDKSYIPKYR